MALIHPPSKAPLPTVLSLEPFASLKALPSAVFGEETFTPSWPAMAACVLLIFSGLATLASRRIAVPTTAHVPGAPAVALPTLSLRRWAIFAAVSVAALALWPTGGAIVVTAASLLTAGVGLAATVLAWKTRHAVSAFTPTLAMAYAGKVGVHIGMWSTWLDRLGQPWCIVVQTPEQFDLVRGLYTTPVILGNIPDSVRGVLYCHGAPKNTRFIDSAPQATHVFLGHGDSDKPLSASERVLAYDRIAVAGQAAIDRFADSGVNVPAEKFIEIGRPQTEGISGPAPSNTTKTVLYAPTWRHADDSKNVSSLIAADRIVTALLDRGVRVIFRRHFAGQNHSEAEAMITRVNDLIASHESRHQLGHRWGAEAMEAPLHEVFNASDAMISDVSGIVVDYLASGKPLALYAAQTDDPATFCARHPTGKAAYVIGASTANLDEALDALLGDDPIAEQRTQLADYYLGKASERREPAARFMKLLEQLATDHRGQ